LKQRFYSLDVFRGATVAFMILVNSPGSWSHLYPPLAHAPWHGVTPTDLVFPFFLFAVGNALAFVMEKFEEAGDAYFWKKIIKRSILIFLIGLFLNWFPFFHWQNDKLIFESWTWQQVDGSMSGVRIFGVLQRIAFCYFFASIIVYYAKARGAFIIGFILLISYWIVCLLASSSDPYSLQGWFGTDIDRQVLGEPHMYKGEGVPFDPEGLISTVPGIVQVVFGYLVGNYLRKRGKAALSTESAGVGKTENPIYKTLVTLFIAAMVLLFVGYAWGLTFPLNKKIWTSSYVALTSGLAICVLATLIYLIEVKNFRGLWSRFFDVFGKNALFIYALSGLIPKLLSIIRIDSGVDQDGNITYINPWGWFYETVTSKFPGPAENGSLLFALCFVFLLWAISYWMDRKKIYIKV